MSASSEGESGDAGEHRDLDHPYYRAYFRCWNEQQYYEAHDVLEQVWLSRRLRGRRFLQRPDSGRRRVCSSAKKLRASDACQAQPAFAAGGAIVSIGRKKSVQLRSAASWPGRRRLLQVPADNTPTKSSPPITPSIPGRPRPRRSLAKSSAKERRLGNRRTGLDASAESRHHLSFYFVKINFAPAIVRTIASRIEIVRAGKWRLPRREPIAPPMIAATERTRPSDGIECCLVK